ncbi:hypothetical protein SAMN04487820_106271 [Actinopolyspora mzabensis]|uniref:Uncharacterized protein n=1 Tax=Actinopolyspora mzabensis TaxID=995066 RepID=A0A1G9AVP1_ACTMZ|nr:hypothetical protein SAMN04487820_106271 [Actinopolyspora mzabensis]
MARRLEWRKLRVCNVRVIVKTLGVAIGDRSSEPRRGRLGGGRTEKQAFDALVRGRPSRDRGKSVVGRGTDHARRGNRSAASGVAPGSFFLCAPALAACAETGFPNAGSSESTPDTRGRPVRGRPSHVRYRLRRRRADMLKSTGRSNRACPARSSGRSVCRGRRGRRRLCEVPLSADGISGHGAPAARGRGSARSCPRAAAIRDARSPPTPC